MVGSGPLHYGCARQHVLSLGIYGPPLVWSFSHGCVESALVGFSAQAFLGSVHPAKTPLVVAGGCKHSSASTHDVRFATH